MAGAVAAPAAAAAATAAASAGIGFVKSIFGFLLSNKIVSLGALTAAGYGLHSMMADDKGNSWIKTKATEWFNWASESAQSKGEKGLNFLWEKAKEHPMIAGIAGVAGTALLGSMYPTVAKYVLPVLVAGALYMGYKYMTSGEFNAKAEGDPSTPQASYRQKLTHKLDIPFIQLRGLAVAGGAPELHNDK